MHPDGFHKSEEAKARCWGCSHPEMLTSTPEEEARAKDLIAKGFRSISNKYCMVERLHLPRFEDAMTFASDVPAWVREKMREAYESGVNRWWLRSDRGEVLELTRGEFLAFRRLGGHSA